MDSSELYHVKQQFFLGVILSALLKEHEFDGII
jgi:hypothetical protein